MLIPLLIGLTGRTATLTPVHLNCEYLVNPHGIDVVQPRLSWQLESTARDQRQSAFEIIVAASPASLAKNKGDLWDSGKVAGNQTTNIRYAGSALKSGEQCFWKVRSWNQNGTPSRWSPQGYFSMGLLKPSDWQGKWIGWDHGAPVNQVASSQWIWYPEGNPLVSAPVGKRYFRRDFVVPTGSHVTTATIGISADNDDTLYVNGHFIGSGKDFNTPGEYDIAPLLKSGNNVLAVVATNEGDSPNPAGLMVKLDAHLSNGAAISIATDAAWKASNGFQSGWTSLRFDDTSWKPSLVLGAYGISPWGNIGGNDRRLPARYLRREFPVAKNVKRATAYVCGLGFFDLFLNGKKVGDHAMDPALSDYFKTDYYVTFDVTHQLKEGKNAIGVILGNGRFFAPRLTVPAITETFGYPKLLLQLNIEYTDGTTAHVVSNGSWKVTTHGPIRTNNEYDGETYDARMEMPGWSAVGFHGKNWKPAEVVSAPGGELKAMMIEPMRVTQILHPVGITHPRPGIYIVDMGQNYYGTVQLKARGKRGDKVTMVSAYSLRPDGLLKTADNRSAQSTDTYTFKGDGVETWHPIFKGQGTRRIEVTGFPGVPTKANFEGLVIHTDVAPVGSFACSDDLVNRIHQAVTWGMKMYLRSEPIDPDRDERQAWLGDPAKDAESEAYNFNVAAFYSKWMRDVRVAERPDGSIPDVATFWTWGEDIVWPSVFTIIPNWYASFYADKHVASRNYAKMRTWVLAMKQRHELADGTYFGGEYGDWCDTSTIGGKVRDQGSTPLELVTTSYQYHNYRIMARLAGLLGRPSDVRMFTQYAAETKTAFNRKFFDAATHTYLGKTQCGYVLALKFGLVPDDERAAVIHNLVTDIVVTHHGHLTVGLTGMQWFMQTLSEIGRPGVAWEVVNQTTRPSWGYMLSKGSTTIWERWDYDTRDPGMNSEALLMQAGNLDAWFYQTLAGIESDPAGPGFQKIFIRPEPVGNLKWVKASYDSVHGLIKSEWNRAGHRFGLLVTVPANTTATVSIPAVSLASVTEGGRRLGLSAGLRVIGFEGKRVVVSVGSGTYHFVSRV